MQKGPGGGPLPLNSGRGNLQNVGGFFNRQTSEETQFDDATLLQVEPSQIIQGIIEGHQFEALAVEHGERILQRHALATVTFACILLSGIVDQNLAHDQCHQPKELSFILKLQLFLIRQAKVGFVNQGGALQSVTGALVSQVPVSEQAQFFVRPWQQRLEGLGIVSWPLRQKFAERPGIGQFRTPQAVRLLSGE
jgi:hypothetical protein